jgi:hypothetical protein
LAISLSSSRPILFPQINPSALAANCASRLWRDGVLLVADLLIGAGFVAVMVTPAIVAGILRARSHKTGF